MVGPGLGGVRGTPWLPLHRSSPVAAEPHSGYGIRSGDTRSSPGLPSGTDRRPHPEPQPAHQRNVRCVAASPVRPGPGRRSRSRGPRTPRSPSRGRGSRSGLEGEVAADGPRSGLDRVGRPIRFRTTRQVSRGPSTTMHHRRRRVMKPPGRRRRACRVLLVVARGDLVRSMARSSAATRPKALCARAGR